MSSTLILQVSGRGRADQTDDLVTTWLAPAAIDADGANGQNGKPFAYRLDDKGLDALANAGYPGKSWRNVLIDGRDGYPLADEHGNLYSSTTYTWPDRGTSTRYVDATTVPYVVVNPLVRKRTRGIMIGARATITYRGKTIEAVCADVSGASDLGEISIAAAELLGIPSSPRNGGTDDLVEVKVYNNVPAVVNGESYHLQAA